MRRGRRMARGSREHGIDMQSEPPPQSGPVEPSDVSASRSGETIPGGQAWFYAEVTVGGGPAPVRAYIEELLPDILEGHIEPGKVLDRTVDLAGVLDGYRAMADRESIKVMVRPSRLGRRFRGGGLANPPAP